MGFESGAISARVTKQIVTIFSKTCNKKYKSTAYKWILTFISHVYVYILLYYLWQVNIVKINILAFAYIMAQFALTVQMIVSRNE